MNCTLMRGHDGECFHFPFCLTHNRQIPGEYDRTGKFLGPSECGHCLSDRIADQKSRTDARIGEILFTMEKIRLELVAVCDVLEGKAGEDDCGMFRNYNAAINDLRGKCAAQHDELWDALEEVRGLAKKVVGRPFVRRLREFAGLQLRELAFRIDGR